MRNTRTPAPQMTCEGYVQPPAPAPITEPPREWLNERKLQLVGFKTNRADHPFTVPSFGGLSVELNSKLADIADQLAKATEKRNEAADLLRERDSWPADEPPPPQLVAANETGKMLHEQAAIIEDSALARFATIEGEIMDALSRRDAAAKADEIAARDEVRQVLAQSCGWPAVSADEIVKFAEAHGDTPRPIQRAKAARVSIGNEVLTLCDTMKRANARRLALRSELPARPAI